MPTKKFQCGLSRRMRERKRSGRCRVFGLEVLVAVSLVGSAQALLSCTSDSQCEYPPCIFSRMSWPLTRRLLAGPRLFAGRAAPSCCPSPAGAGAGAGVGAASCGSTLIRMSISNNQPCPDTILPEHRGFYCANGIAKVFCDGRLWNTQCPDPPVCPAGQYSIGGGKNGVVYYACRSCDAGKYASTAGLPPCVCARARVRVWRLGKKERKIHLRLCVCLCLCKDTKTLAKTLTDTHIQFSSLMKQKIKGKNYASFASKEMPGTVVRGSVHGCAGQ